MLFFFLKKEAPLFILPYFGSLAKSRSIILSNSIIHKLFHDIISCLWYGLVPNTFCEHVQSRQRSKSADCNNMGANGQSRSSVEFSCYLYCFCAIIFFTVRAFILTIILFAFMHFFAAHQYITSTYQLDCI